MRFIILIIYFISIFKFAYSTNIYNTDEYTINFFSNNINIEKEININNIKVKSFKTILEKILTKKNYKQLEKEIDLFFVNNFILNMTINDEQIINNNYYSKIKINFNKDSIINYLINNKINYTDSLPNKFLLIIYEENKIENNLLSKKNNFYDYLLNTDNDFFLKFFLIPKLDFNDRFIFNKDNYDNDLINSVIKLNEKYSTDYQILLHSKFHENYYLIKFFLINENQIIFIDEKKIINLDYKNIFFDIYYESLDRWKEFNEININLINKLECKIVINNIQELKFLRNILKSNRIIKNLDLKSIMLNENIYNIVYFGNIDIFKKSLIKSRLKLFFKEDQCNIELI